MPPTPANTEQCDAMRPGEVAELLGVHPRTVANWSRLGLLRTFRTPGGHRRFPREAIMAIYEGQPKDAAPYPIGTVPAQRQPSED